MPRLVLPLLAALAALSLGQSIDELGDDTNVYNNFNGAGRGNKVTVTTTVELIEIRQSVNLDSVMDLNFVVKRETAPGTYSIEFNHLVPAQGPGHPPFWSSGPISHILQAGESYAIMMYWSASGDYYNDNSSPVFGPLSFGNHDDNAYENSYPPSPYVGSVSHSWIPHQWYVTQSPCTPAASLAVRTVAGPAIGLVLLGDTGVPVTVEVENTGTGDADSLVVALTFMGTADRTAEYTVTPDPGNPTTLAGGVLATFNFSVDVSPTATLETITIDAGVDGNDVLCTVPLQDPDADTPGSWMVVECLATHCGDCTGDGQVSILDALAAAQHSAGLIILQGGDFSNCNVTGLLEPDPAAEVTVLDALTIAQSSAGLGTTLACC